MNEEDVTFFTELFTLLVVEPCITVLLIPNNFGHFS